MKAAQVLLLLIAFIAASHLRRDTILIKHRVAAHMQQNGGQAIAENVNWLKDNSSPAYSGGGGSKMAMQKMSFNYDRKRQ
jgi:hypothetical protein